MQFVPELILVFVALLIAMGILLTWGFVVTLIDWSKPHHRHWSERRDEYTTPKWAWKPLCIENEKEAADLWWRYRAHGWSAIERWIDRRHGERMIAGMSAATAK